MTSAKNGNGYRFVSPVLILLLLITVYPVLYVVYLSLNRRLLIFDISRFAGIENYLFLLRDDRFWNALKNTVYFTVSSVTLELLTGLSIALLLNRQFRMKGIIRAIVLIPWAVPTVVSAKMWEWIYNTDFGILNYITGIKINWLGSPLYETGQYLCCRIHRNSPDEFYSCGCQEIHPSASRL
ncbi:MAG: sugar ABC transporter permease [Nitrospirae bacterium]|nr:sugar ABC transporter permease [Nitrospirota bacterium]